MASSTTLSTVLARDVAFHDVDKLNEAIRTAMIEDWDAWEPEDVVVGFDGKNLLFRGYEARNPVALAEVWSTWSLETSKLVARHMSSGKLVLKLHYEWNEQEYHVLTPGNAEVADITKLFGG
jgi:hypothetical protein